MKMFNLGNINDDSLLSLLSKLY